jgi:hypothetical protein
MILNAVFSKFFFLILPSLVVVDVTCVLFMLAEYRAVLIGFLRTSRLDLGGDR